MSNEKMSFNTTMNDHFKWNHQNPTRNYNNYPSNIGEIIFPSNSRQFTSSFSESFRLLENKKPDLSKRSENIGWLKPEGNKFIILY